VRERIAAFAPGRVNLIGEHTDYNQGLCLPFAIEAGVTVTAEPAAGRAIEARTLGLREEDRFELGERSPGVGWRRFVRGSAGELQDAGVEVGPARIEIASDLPVGAGLASSAALCVALCLALCSVSESPVPEPVELARLCSRVENRWIGARTGLLDQLASLCGRQGHAVRIDMGGPTVTAVPLPLDGHRLATLDSGASRELATAGYNRRREECEAACEALGVGFLREAELAEAERLPQPLASRVRHVLSENGRVDAMVRALEGRDLAEAGRLLDASHRSLRDDYDVSVPAVEQAVRRAKAGGALGARIVGGGFGGHVLALFPPGRTLPEGALPVAPAAGARVIC
jgi:galactokinase